MVRRAFDRGITHFDLANNYGPPYGQAEINFVDAAAHRSGALSRRTHHLDQGRLGHVARVRGLNQIAADRGQSLAQMALAWVLRDPRMTSTLIGASSVAQLDDNLGALGNLEFSDGELSAIDTFAVESGVNLWQRVTRD